jgi:hypothetical protein
MDEADGGAAPDRDSTARQSGDRDDDAASRSSGDSDRDGGGDTFGVGIYVTDAEFRLVVHVPSDIDSGWSDPEAFQRAVERTVWDRLDRDATLRRVGERAVAGETVTLGRVTLQPDGTVVGTEFDAEVAAP